MINIADRHIIGTKPLLKLALGTFSAFILLCVFSGTVLYYIYRTDVASEIALYMEKEDTRLHLVEERICIRLGEVISDLLFLSDLVEARRCFTGNAKEISEMETDLLLFSKNKRIYDQIRYINEDGMEIIRVNYNSGKPVIVGEKTSRTNRLATILRRYPSLGREAYIFPRWI